MCDRGRGFLGKLGMTVWLGMTEWLGMTAWRFFFKLTILVR